ncbi:unnamed protein product [Blepharisma stoltei]|uniref:Uncharacterized protein n=1 Tax=Blepharisma stoltei TaxID=1481888 RepID=A0AAU9IHP6_9CILI|nr:unnamed protein product [Blepharisma stoltei]
MCLILCKPVVCDHPFCVSFYTKMGGMRVTLLNNDEDHYLSVINYQNAVLTDLVEYNKKSFEAFDNLLAEAKSLGRFLANTRHADLVMETSITDEQIFSSSTKEDSYKYELKLIEKFPEALWKERGFSIRAFVQDKSRESVYLHKFPRFRVFLYTMDEKPKLLNLNVAGKKVLRGTIEAEMKEDSTIYFKNLVINEVSSHYTNDAFQIVVANLNSSAVKPLILSGIHVRARRLVKK